MPRSVAWHRVPALSAQPHTGWASQARMFNDKIVWTVTAPADSTMIRALGFFGLMAVGAHHQPHHLAITRGTTAR